MRRLFLYLIEFERFYSQIVVNVNIKLQNSQKSFKA